MQPEGVGLPIFKGSSGTMGLKSFIKKIAFSSAVGAVATSASASANQALWEYAKSLDNVDGYCAYMKVTPSQAMRLKAREAVIEKVGHCSCRYSDYGEITPTVDINDSLLSNPNKALDGLIEASKMAPRRSARKLGVSRANDNIDTERLASLALSDVQNLTPEQLLYLRQLALTSSELFSDETRSWLVKTSFQIQYAG